MLNKIKNSLAYRLPILYNYFIRLTFILEKKYPAIKENDTYNLVILCGSAQLNMLNVCLKSIYNNFKQLPHIYVITDQSLSAFACKKAIHWFPENNITVIDALNCLAYHEEKGNHLVKQFALKNPMGLKLAAILQVINLGKPILYSDTDVIWYNDPIADLANFLNIQQFNLALSVDFQAAYDNNLIDNCNLTELNKEPYFCAGILFINKLIEKHYSAIENLLPAVIRKSDHFSEQTIFALLNKQSGNFCLDKNKFIIELNDRLNFFPTKNKEIIARHYIGPVRHLFWRDTIFSRY
ncbi:MAG: hypothetical protein JWQ63_1432 [Mucilaginibacter sp.]|nr:hypothetical protein [Mucilaginibacter sp.]